MNNVILSEEDDFFDLTLPIKKFTSRLFNSYYSIMVEGTYVGESIGFVILVNKNIQAGLVNDGQEITINSKSFKKDAIEFKSLGEVSDNFIQLIEKLYLNQQTASLRLRPSIKFTAIALMESKLDIKGYSKLKLFYEPNDQNDYFELYLNIDLEREIVELREKDPDYRENVVKGLSE